MPFDFDSRLQVKQRRGEVKSFLRLTPSTAMSEEKKQPTKDTRERASCYGGEYHGGQSELADTPGYVTTDAELCEALKAMENKLRDNMKELPPEYSKLIEDNIGELLC